MVETRQNAPLNKDFFDSALIDKFVDQHLFQGIELLASSHSLGYPALQLILLKLDLEDGTICTISDSTSLSKIRPSQCFAFNPSALSCLGQICLTPLLKRVTNFGGA